MKVWLRGSFNLPDKADADPPSALSAYWKLYGGIPALVRSKYVWGSLLATVLLSRTWSTEAARADLGGTIISIIPNLLGFTVGAMAILLAFSGSRFFSILTQGGDSDSAYLDLASKFVHFILVQSITLLGGIAIKSYPHSIHFGFVVSFFLIYAIFTAVATSLALFGMAEIYNRIASSDDEK